MRLASLLPLVLCPALAQDGPDLLPEDRAGMEQCLQSARGRGARADECIGFVQDPCQETPDGQSTAGSVACIAREHAFWDRLLNQTYAQLREAGTDEPNADLRDLQREWLAWREARCAYEAQQYEGGTYANVAANHCFTQETARRAIDLGAMLTEDEEPYLLEE
jgi:uncharacterized protein YecT (DUF1311 family)